MLGAIPSRGIGGRVDICGKGKFNLNSKEKTIIEELNIKDNIEFDLGIGSPLHVGKSLWVEEGARLNVVNGGTNIVGMYRKGREGKVDMEVGYSVGNNRLKVRSYVGVNTVVIRLKGYEEEGEYPLRLEVKLCIVRLGN